MMSKSLVADILLIRLLIAARPVRVHRRATARRIRRLERPGRGTNPRQRPAAPRNRVLDGADISLAALGVQAEVDLWHLGRVRAANLDVAGAVLRVHLDCVHAPGIRRLGPRLVLGRGSETPERKGTRKDGDVALAVGRVLGVEGYDVGVGPGAHVRALGLQPEI